MNVRIKSKPRPPIRSRSSGSKGLSSEETLKTDSIQIERKRFQLTLKQNARGRFLRITEDVNGRRDSIIIPATGLTDFKRLLDEMVKANTANEPQ